MIAEEHTANETPPEEMSPDDQASEEEVKGYLAQYWCSEQDGDKLWSTIEAKERENFDAWARRNMFVVMRLSYSMYFGTSNQGNAYGSWETQSLSYGGENGELINFSANQYKSFQDQILNLVCKNRPAFQAQAINTDFKSMAEVESADSLVAFFYDDVFGERKEREVVKIAQLYGKSASHVSFDPDAGDIIEFEEQVPTPYGPTTTMKKGRAGKLVINRCFPWDFYGEPFRSEYEDHLWRVVIGAKVAKVEMQARYPLFAKEIESSSLQPHLYEYSIPGSDPMQQEAEGLCAVRTFYHAKTMAIPAGRKVIFVNNVKVFDDELPLDSIPVIPFFSNELHGTGFGVSALWDIMPLDQISNQVLSDIATNLEAFGRPSLSLVEGSDIDIDALANGQKIVFVPPGRENRPEPIKFPEMPSIAFKALELFSSMRQSISGLNAIARGDTSTNITSGAHAALYSQIAVEAQSDLTLALDLHRERVGNLIIENLKKFCRHPQLVAVAGVDERSYLQSFESKDWDGIKRVKIKSVNPQMRTMAGRLQLVDMLKDFPGTPLKDPQQIVELLSTGLLKPMLNSTRTAELRIRYENEKLLKGPEVTQIPGPPDPMTGMPTMKDTVADVPILITDNVTAHLYGHLELLNQPATLGDPKISKAVLTHLAEHVAMARKSDPYLAMLLSNPGPEQQATPGQAPPPQASTQQQQPGAGPAPYNAPQKAGGVVDQTDDSKTTVPSPSKPPANSAM